MFLYDPSLAIGPGATYEWWVVAVLVLCIPEIFLLGILLGLHIAKKKKD